MTARSTLPFRADHVGSFLRPKVLLEAREGKARGEISAAGLRKVEDKAIAGIVKFQEETGLQAITDGEFRRTFAVAISRALGRRRAATNRWRRRCFPR